MNIPYITTQVKSPFLFKSHLMKQDPPNRERAMFSAYIQKHKEHID